MTDELIAQLRLRANDPATRIGSINHVAVALTPTLTSEQFAETENNLGLRLPSVLTTIYHSVANGGFGPGYGLLGLIGGFADDDNTAIDYYHQFNQPDPEDAGWLWPRSLLPICHWGCCIYSCIDCETTEGRIITFDPGARHLGESMPQAFAETHHSMESWLNDWVSGIAIWSLMFEPDQANAKQFINPFTRESTMYVPNKLRRQMPQIKISN